MKKRIILFIALVLACACMVAFAAVALAAEGEEAQTITVSYMKTQETTSDTTALDTKAYENGKQVVGVGEKFTLPTTADSTYVGQEGYQLVWYTENGRTYKAGEEVSFDKDTKLYRCVAKEVYTMSDLNYAMTNNSTAAILMTDITTDVGISVYGQGQSVLILNGFTLNISKNGHIMGAQRSGKHIYGEGTINVTNPDGKLGSYAFFQDQSHGYNGSANRSVVGCDVVINAPNFWLGADGDGSYNNHYPWTRVYGTINVYGLYSITNSNNRAPFVEFFETANVTITGPELYKDLAGDAINNQSFETAIYGGTFNLPAKAASLEFWTNDYLEEYVVGTKTYLNYGLNKHTKDVIKIYSGSFVLPDNATPAIADFLTADFIGSVPSGGNGLVSNSNTSTYHVCYGVRPAYKLAFEKYAEGEYGKLTVTDYLDGSLTGTYYYTAKKGEIAFENHKGTAVSWTTIDELLVYELDAESGEYTLTDKFELGFALGGTVMFSNAAIKADKALYSFEANGTTYQTVVPAGCAHSFTGAPVDATCQSAAYADYNCSLCGYNAYFSWGEKADHAYTVTEHTEATLNSLGSKTYECATCGNVSVRPYTLDPSNLDVKVTLRHDDGTFENVTVKASDVFEFATAGSGDDLIYTVSAIKVFGENSVRNIYGITIPQGILYFNISKQNYEKFENVEYGVAVLTVAEGSTVDILNIGNLRRLEKIVIEKNTNVKFGSSCSWFSPNNEQRKPNILSTIDMSAGNHNVTFVSACFEGRETVTTVKLGENSTYDFGYRTFYNCAIDSLVFPASSKYIFTGTYAFYGNDMEALVFPDNVDFTFTQSTFENCPNLTSVTFGQNSTYDIGAYTFLYCPIPKVVLASNSSYTIGNRAFINTALTELDMSAGNMTVFMSKEAFNCWQSSKLFCVLDTIKFGENSSYEISEAAFSNISATSLTLAPNSEYIFRRYCINGDNNKTEFKKIDASADNITVLFDNDSFRSRLALDTVLVGGKNSTYTFNNTSFYETIVKEIVLGENSTYTFGNCFEKSLIETLDASADGITLTVNNWAFGRSTFKNLLINGKNGSYTFKNESFKNSIVESITLGEGSTYVFENGSFGSVSTITSINAGANNVDVTIKDYTFCDKSALVTLDISGQNSTYNIGREAFRKTGITGIKFGEGSSYTLGYQCFYGNTVIESVDMSASNITANISSQAFNNCKTVKYIAFGENSTYTIGEYAFNNCQAENAVVFAGTSSFNIGKYSFYGNAFESIVFEDYVDATFAGADAFRDCTNTKYLYLGKNFQLDNYPFKRLGDLEKLVIMDGVKFKDDQTEEWFFDSIGYSDRTTPIVVYNHSTDLVFTKSMFNDCDGIVLYTVTSDIGTRTDVFSNCTDGTGYKGFTVVLGIPHALKEGPNVDSTCTLAGGTTWAAADCDCGILYRGTSFDVNVYENKHNITAETVPARVDTYAISPIPALGHEKGEFITIVYGNGYLATGVASYHCARCADAEGNYEENANAIFESIGYSVSTYLAAPAMTQGFRIDYEAYTAYTSVVPSFTFGVVAVGNSAGDARQPLSVENGAIVAENKAVIGKVNNAGVGFFEAKVRGLNENSLDKNIIFCAYIFDGETVMYIDDGEIKDSVAGVSYSALATE